MVFHTASKARVFFRAAQYPTTILLISALAGCTAFGITVSTTNELPARPSVDALVRQADDELAKNHVEPAAALLNQAAKENPTSIAPWLKLAMLWFNAGRYSKAIAAANEALERDADSQEAKNIIVAAGIRVATGVTKGLLVQNIANANVRAEADNLSRILRGTPDKPLTAPAGPADGTQKNRPAPGKASSGTQSGGAALTIPSSIDLKLGR
jgi:cytochrome c-type biogenesis protein CcmH/NrfG